MDKIIEGAKIKLLVGFRYPADDTVTLETINFRVVFFCDPGRQLILEKDNLFFEEEEGGGTNWYAIVDTAVTGPGILHMRFFADIPDDDSVDGIREERVEVNTGYVIVK